MCMERSVTSSTRKGRTPSECNLDPRSGRERWPVQDSALRGEFVFGLQTSGEVPRQELLDATDRVLGDVRQHMPQIGGSDRTEQINDTVRHTEVDVEQTKGENSRY